MKQAASLPTAFSPNAGKQLEDYEERLAYVQAVVNDHPEAESFLEGEDGERFRRYFRPDWVMEGHFVTYAHKLDHEEPDWIAHAERLWQRFQAAYPPHQNDKPDQNDHP